MLPRADLPIVHSRTMLRCWVAATLLGVTVAASSHGVSFVGVSSLGAAGGGRVALIDELQPVTFSAEGNPPDLTADGRWLAYGVADREAAAERVVYVRDMVEGTTRALTDRGSKDGWSTAPRWSPDGRWLAFFVKRDGKPRLALWDRERDRIHVVLDAPTPGLPLSVSWSERDNTLFVVTNADAASPSGATPSGATPAGTTPEATRVLDTDQKQPSQSSSPRVTVWRSAGAKRTDLRGQPGENSGGEADAPLKSDGIFDLTGGGARPIPKHDVWKVTVGANGSPQARWLMRGAAIDQLGVSPDGRWLAVFGNRRIQVTEGLGQTALMDLFFVPADSKLGERVPADGAAVWTSADGRVIAPVETGIAQSPSRKGLSWAPNSRAVAYVSSGIAGTGDVFVAALPDQRGKSVARNVTAGAAYDALARPEAEREGLGEEYRRFSYSNREPCGAPLWTSDSQALLRAAADDIWYIPVNGGALRNLTSRSRHLSFNAVVAFVHPGGIRQAVGDASSVLVHAVDKSSTREGIWRVGLKDDGLSAVVERPQMLRIGGGYGDVSESANLMVTAASAFNDPQELWSISGTPASGGTGAPELQQLTSSNHHDAAWLRNVQRRDLRWVTPAGRSARGVLMLPDPALTPERPPVILYAYPGNRSTDYGQAFGVYSGVEAPAFLSRGYAVFIVDLPITPMGVYGPDGPDTEIVNAVEAAVKALLGTGLVDDKRLVAMGQSYGGQMVNTLLTRTTRFAAGIAGSGVSNLTSAAGSSIYGMPFYENGQGRMGATLWSEPGRYVANSPVFALDRVDAPLLLFHGERDSGVPIEQAEQMYRGLARLGKDVTLLRYRDLSHTFDGKAVREDLWSRILGWLDQRVGPQSLPSTH